MVDPADEQALGPQRGTVTADQLGNILKDNIQEFSEIFTDNFDGEEAEKLLTEWKKICSNSFIDEMFVTKNLTIAPASWN